MKNMPTDNRLHRTIRCAARRSTGAICHLWPRYFNRRLLSGAMAACLLAVWPGAYTKGDPMNPNTDWFQKAGYGVFVHYLDGLQNNREQIHSLGKQTSWDECVREFDTERFAQTMKEVGAGYVIFTVMQLTRHMIAPNTTYDRITGYRPGEACATRDLIEDLYRSLHKRNIPLMLYWTGDGPSRDPKAGQAFGCGTPVSEEFVRKWTSVVEEYSKRYGSKIAGWWVDGMYPWIGYDDKKLAMTARALKAGNPHSIVALNRGVDPAVMPYTPHEDFTAGEQNRFFDVPVTRWLQGEQWHILSFLGPNWAQPGCAYTKASLAEYVGEVHRRGGVVSIDVLLYRDGALDRSQVEVLKAVRAELDHGGSHPPVPPGNLAYHKQAKLLSLDGTRELPVNSGVHFPRLGVDGRLDTFAEASDEWPWCYEVDLVDTVPIRRIKVTFAPQGYATHFQVRISADRVHWTTAADVDHHDGKPWEGTFAPIEGRYVRVCALKPDGPGQPGGQMAIAELEVYR